MAMSGVILTTWSLPLPLLGEQQAACGSVLFLVFPQDISQPLLDSVEVPAPLIADNRAQHRVDAINRIQEVLQQVVLLAAARDLSWHPDHVTENRPFGA